MNSSLRHARLVTVSVLGRPARSERQNDRRADLLARSIYALGRLETWWPLDAVVFPAGFFTSALWLGPYPSEERAAVLQDDALGTFCRRAARRLDRRSPGCVLVVGLDTTKPDRRWRGDQLAIVARGDNLLACPRKIFPVDGDTNGDGRAPYLLFEHDYGDASRSQTLPAGGNLLISVCYDVYSVVQLVSCSSSKLRAFRHVVGLDGAIRVPDADDARRLLSSYAAMLLRERPIAHAVAVHGFRGPGLDVYWQRHGMAAASAALDGALTVGAAHFLQALPEADRSTLAARRVSRRHLRLGCERPNASLLADAAYFIETPDQHALLRLYRG